jgi:hypothetical protein
MVRINRPLDNTWRTSAWDVGTVSDHAQRFAMRLEKAGLEIRSVESGEERMSWAEVVQAFADASGDAVDEHVRNQHKKAAYIDAQRESSQSPEEDQETPHHISAQSIIVRFMNGSEEIIHTHHPMVAEGGWTFRNMNGVPYLVIGHGIPRRQYPACNIAFIELSGEVL